MRQEKETARKNMCIPRGPCMFIRAPASTIRASRAIIVMSKALSCADHVLQQGYEEYPLRPLVCGGKHTEFVHADAPIPQKRRSLPAARDAIEYEKDQVYSHQGRVADSQFSPQQGEYADQSQDTGEGCAGGRGCHYVVNPGRQIVVRVAHGSGSVRTVEPRGQHQPDKKDDHARDDDLELLVQQSCGRCLSPRYGLCHLSTHAIDADARFSDAPHVGITPGRRTQGRNSSALFHGRR
mmetsp:Transcript_15218/g.34192  ORF Transcript_15218/g.34192 Transcript_15218/m.34192 type:complete len:238 (+) Transcript_15218:114-827(+)